MNALDIKQKRIESFSGASIVNEWYKRAYEQGIEDAFNYGLPEPEIVASFVHDAWMQEKLRQGIKSRMSETGEELMVPFHELSENAKKLDIATVTAVFDALKKAIQEEESFPGNPKDREGFEG